MQQVQFHDLGNIDFRECWDLQEQLLNKAVERKMQNRELPADAQIPAQHHLLFCEHPHVYTLGKSGHEKHLLVNAQFLEKIKATYYRINRGGDITYHGPGQLIGYPILDLDYFFNDIHLYLRYLEEAVILMLADYGITGGRTKGQTGVWLDPENPQLARKICAYGVRCSRWVTMHGFALNINTDLSYFNHIVPCGITDKTVTSMQQELGRTLDMQEVKDKVKHYFVMVFNCEIIAAVPAFKEETAQL